jgi:tRNA (cytidine/uridine-2'-O-)-methyltransferase
MAALPLHLVLVEPEIPPNTGNVARLCGATGSVLHLVGKLGFTLDDKQLKRAGLDYWPVIDVRRWDSLDQLWSAFPDARCWFTSKNAARCYSDAAFRPGDFLIFGRETSGLPPDLLAVHAEQAIRIPIFIPEVRSLNLSTAAGIVLYEALRQTGRLA